MGRNTTGTLVKRGRTYSLRYVVGGKLKVISLGTSNKKEAESKREDILGRALKAETVEDVALHVARARKLTIGRLAVLDAWETFKGIPKKLSHGEKVEAQYELRWSRFASWCSDNNIQWLELIRPEDAQKYMVLLGASGLSNQTINATRTQIGAIFRSLMAAGRISTQNPFEVVAKLPDTVQGREALTLEQVRKMLALFEDSAFIVRDKMELHVAVLLGLSCGLRLSDTCNLKWESVDMERKIIQLIPSKVKKHRKLVTVYIHDTLYAILSNMRKDSSFVLPALHERHLRDSSRICRVVERLFEKIDLHNPKEVEGQRLKKVAKYGFHSFRHTYVSLSAAGGVPIHVVQAAIGHGNPEMTRRYLHHQIEGLKAASDALKLTE